MTGKWSDGLVGLVITSLQLPRPVSDPRRVPKLLRIFLPAFDHLKIGIDHYQCRMFIANR